MNLFYFQNISRSHLHNEHNHDYLTLYENIVAMSTQTQSKEDHPAILEQSSVHSKQYCNMCKLMNKNHKLNESFYW